MTFGARLVLAAFLIAAAGSAPAAAADLVRLQRGLMRVDVAPSNGGELAGLEIERNGRWVQLLYRGDDYSKTADWTGKAPILWPATGRSLLADGRPGWRSGDADYPMAIHGFARDLPWKLVRVQRGVKRAAARLTLEDTPFTRARYPFGFKLTTDYILAGDSLTIRQTVHASRSNARPMPFSIGNHITFNLPLVPGGSAAAVRFETPARRQILADQRGLPTGQVQPVDFRKPTPVGALQTRNAVSLGDYPQSRAWVRLIDPSGLSVTLSHVESRLPSGEPVLFNLWGDVGAGFFAPEPWVGKQNALNTGDGAVALQPGQDFHWAVSIVLDRDGVE